MTVKLQSGGAGQANTKLPALWSVVKVIAGNGGYVALGFVANIVSANGLTPAGFGLVAISLAILNVLQEICGNGVDLAMVRLAAPHAKTNPAIAQGYYIAALKYKLVMNLLVAVPLWFTAPSLAGWIFNDPQMTLLLRWVCAGLMGAAIYNYAISCMQAEERFGQYAILRVANNLAKLAMLGLIWLLGVFNPNTVFASWIVAFFIGYVMALLFKRAPPIKCNAIATSSDPDNRAYLKEVFHFSKWLIGSSFLFCLYSRMDMLILGRYVDAAEIGQYAAAWNITFIIDLMTYSVIIALLPRAAGLTTKAEFSEYMKHTFLICLGICVMISPLYFLSDLFFELFFPAYSSSAGLFRVLLSGALITLLLHPLYLILYARNRVNRLTLINFILVIFSVILGFACIPSYGAMGAAWVTVCGRVLASLLILYFVYRELNASLQNTTYKLAN